MELADAIREIASRVNRIEWEANRRYYDVLIESVQKANRGSDSSIDAAFPNPEKIYWTLALKEIIETNNRKAKGLTADYEAFASEFQAEPSRERRLALALAYYQAFRGKEARMKKARKIFEKYLEVDPFWEGYRKRSEEIQILIGKAFLCIGHLLFDCLVENFERAEDRADGIKLLLSEYGFEQTAVDQIQASPRDRTRIEAAAMLRRLAQASADGSTLFSFPTFRLVSGLSQNTSETIWLQIEALKTVFALYREEALALFRLRLIREKKKSDDNLFVHKWVVHFLGESLQTPTGFELLRDFLQEPEPSEYVRMATVRSLGSFAFDQGAPILTVLCMEGPRQDPSPQVRAACIESLVQSALDSPDESTIGKCAELLGQFLRTEPMMFAQRICLEQMVRLVQRSRPGDAIQPPERAILRAIGDVIENPEIQGKVRYWAGIYKEKILFLFDPALRSALAEITGVVADMKQGGRRRLPATLSSQNLDTLGRTLAFLSQEDFGYYVNNGNRKIFVEKGDRFRFQWWRFFFEITNPSPEKRRNYRHTQGRHFRGTIRAHSDILGELTTTKVPGEPLVVWDEGSWRRHIPLVDDCLSLVRSFHADQEVRLYSSLGITTLTGPEGFIPRLRSYFRMTMDYKRLADLRNSHPGNKQSPDIRKYVEALHEKCGITVRFQPYENEVGDGTYAPVDPDYNDIFGETT